MKSSKQHSAVLFCHDFHLPEMLETLYGKQQELHQKQGEGRKSEIHWHRFQFNNFTVDTIFICCLQDHLPY